MCVFLLLSRVKAAVWLLRTLKGYAEGSFSINLFFTHLFVSQSVKGVWFLKNIFFVNIATSLSISVSLRPSVSLFWCVTVCLSICLFAYLSIVSHQWTVCPCLLHSRLHLPPWERSSLVLPRIGLLPAANH